MGLQKRTLVALASLLHAIVVAVPSPALAADEQKHEEQRQSTLDERVGERLNRAVKLLAKKNYAESKYILTRLEWHRLSPYARSRVAHILTVIAMSQKDYPGARKQLEIAIDSGGLNDEELSRDRFQIAQIFMAEEKWQDGITALKAWFDATPHPNAAAYYLLALGYYQVGNYQASLAPAEHAFEISDDPPEGWLQLLLVLRMMRKEYQEAVPIAKRLVAIDPANKTHWLQLSSLEAQTKDRNSAAAVLQIAKYGNLLSDLPENQQLAEVLLWRGIPDRAARQLEEALKAGTPADDPKYFQTLAECWIAAREYARAVPPLREAAARAPDGSAFLRLGEVLIRLEDWAGAADALRQALDKGGLHDPGNAQLLLGIALYSKGAPDEARPWFERALESSSSKSLARGWLNQIEREGKVRSVSSK